MGIIPLPLVLKLKTMKTPNKVTRQKRSIANYRKVGIEIIEYDDTVKIKQSKLYNGLILNQKQLVMRAKKIFPDKKIRPVVFSLDISFITLDWIKAKMEEFGIKRKDLIRQLAIDKSSLSLLLKGDRKMNKLVKSAFFYYFLTYELNKDLREEIQ